MANKVNLGNAIISNSPGVSGDTFEIAGYGDVMPGASFYATATPIGQLSTMGNSEIVLVTAKSTDDLTVTRAQKGTTAQDIAAGWILSNGVYVEDLDEKADQTDLVAHVNDTANPHSVTKTQVGLGNVDNTSDTNKPISTATQAALDTKAPAISIPQSSVPYRTLAGFGAPDTSFGVSSGVGAGTIASRDGAGALAAATPTAASHLTRKDYVDTADALKVNKAGDTMTGTLTVPQINFTGGPRQLTGVGFPNGVVSAPVGSIYIDTAVTNGASSWIKKSGTGNTGWTVLEGDTGWRNISSLINTTLITAANPKTLIRRVNNNVEVLFDFTVTASSFTTEQDIFTTATIPGFDSNSSVWARTLQLDASYQNGFALRPSGYRLGKTSIGSALTSLLRMQAFYTTTQAWPTTLPGTVA